MRQVMRWRGHLLVGGWLLYAVAIVIGPAVILEAPRAAVRLLSHGTTAFLGVTLLIAVSANVALFLKLPRGACAGYAVAAWLPLPAAIATFHVSLAAVRFVPSYLPWALGITSIMTARALALKAP